MKNLLNALSPQDVILEPFPHIRIEHALPDEICDALIRELPEVSLIAGESARENTRADLTMSMTGTKKVSDLWLEFMRVNSDQEFLNDFLRIFGEHITLRYPHLAGYVTGEKTMRSGVRDIDSFENADILLDANIGVNTPIVSHEATSVRTAHIDDPRKLYGGLLYLRNDTDDSEGGEFVVYRYKDDVSVTMTRQQINMECVAEVARVPYKKGTLVLFLNAFDAVHGVTPRMPTKHPRWFLNIVGEFREPLFDISRYQERGFRKFIRRIAHKLGYNLGGVQQRK